MTNNPLSDFETEIVIITELYPHPRNYRFHPEDQIDHIIESIKEHGLYRNIVIARDGTILAGHGVVKAISKMGWKEIPVIRLDINPNDPRALKVLAGDNEIGHLGEIDDRSLTEILKEIKEFDVDGLLGTGYDEKMLANLVFVTRPESEIEDFDAAEHWVGMPEYEPIEEPYRVVVKIEKEEDIEKFILITGLRLTKTQGKTLSGWWPYKEVVDAFSVRLEGTGE